jgi:hypothetical protein
VLLLTDVAGRQPAAACCVCRTTLLTGM